MFQIIGAMAEFERALIQERVRAGLRNARTKGVTLGRQRRIVNLPKVAMLRAQRASWRAISDELGVRDPSEAFHKPSGSPDATV